MVSRPISFLPDQPLIECIPNFSEGKNVEVIDAIVDAIKSVEGIKVLHVDAGFDANRTVITFVGTPEQVVEAAFRSIKTAAELIDMRTHKGIHPRVGATDVCPLVPLQNISLKETAELARKLGQRVGELLKIPVYLYEAAATADYRKNLATIRKPQYEGLKTMLSDPKWQPDFYPYYNARSGATVMGARPFLIAYNVNLNTSDERIAKKIAAIIRTSGTAETSKGMFSAVKAIGWYVETYQCAQVSMNLVDFEITPPHVVYEAIKTLALQFGCEVKGSELIGLIPKSALLKAAVYYAPASHLSEAQQLAFAVEKLGLNALGNFIFKKRVIEYVL